MIDRDEIQSIAAREIQSAVEYYESNAEPDLARAQDYYRGVMLDLPAPEGRSQFVSRDVHDGISAIMPGLMRIFCGSADTCRIEPRDERGVAIARQQSVKLNYEFRSRLDGYTMLYSAIHDALKLRNGIIKVWWSDSDDGEAGEASGLTLEQLNIYATDEMVAISAIEERPDAAAGVVYDIKFKRRKRPHLKAEAVPREEFLISSEAKSLERARLVGHRQMRTRGDLTEMGFDAEIIDSIPSHSSLETNLLASERLEQTQVVFSGTDDAVSRENQMVEYVEAFMRVDIDGDGIAERLKLCMAGGDSQYVLLADPEEVEDDPPFVDIKGLIRPHQFEGESLADKLIDVQRGKSALWRGFLDNIYSVLNPQREVVESQIIDPDELLSQQIGQIVRVKSANVVREMPVPFVGDSAIAGMTLLDDVGAKRTGISRQSAALDGEALKPETAMAASIRQDAGYAQTELIARNLADGIRKLFVKMLKLITSNQDWVETIRLNGQPVDIDPRSWNVETDVIIDVGLGTGSRERDLAMLMQIGAEQDKIVSAFGPNNPWVSPRKWIHTRKKMVEVSGGIGPDQYFGEVPDEAAQQWLDQKSQAETEAAQAPIKQAIAVEQLKAETTLQSKAADASLKEKEISTRDATDRYKADLTAMTQIKLKEMDITKDLIATDATLKNQRGMQIRQHQAESVKARQEAEQGEADDMAENDAPDGEVIPKPLPTMAEQLQPIVDQIVAALTAPKRAVKQADGSYASEVISNGA